MTDSKISQKAGYENLKASKYSYERYMAAKYYKNLTDSQFVSTKTPKYVDSGLSRSTLNPAINLKRLRDRIATTEAIAKRYTPQQRDWVRYTLERVGSQAWKYKINFFLKVIVVYKLYSEISHYRYLKSHTVMTGEVDMAHMYSIFQWAGLSFFTFCLI